MSVMFFWRVAAVFWLGTTTGVFRYTIDKKHKQPMLCEQICTSHNLKETYSLVWRAYTRK